ncbi:MAG: type II toxin-antitoxin system VapC family toxin [Longimicrobiales bacterium]|nr:type II toxin-antitoxin system VapC family toxin [Longimicrobiales bacterium]
MNDNVVVVDASALAALLFGEPAGPEIAERLDGRTLLAPSLLRYELASVCLKKTREEPEKGKELLMSLGLLPRLAVQEVQVPTEGLADVARMSGLTAYDAAYLWLARELEVELVSLDARLNAARANPL